MKPLTIGVAGGTGSGKTTVTKALMESVGPDNVAFFPHDAYYRDYSHLTLEERTQVNWDHPASLQTELLVSQLSDLISGKAIERPLYDFRTYSRLLQTQHIEPHPVVIVEGILILAEADLRSLLDLKVFVDADADVRFIRRLRRDITERNRAVESVIAQYLTTVRPMHLEFVEPSKRYADLIIPEGGYNRVAIDMLVKAVSTQLGIPSSG